MINVGSMVVQNGFGEAKDCAKDGCRYVGAKFFHGVSIVAESFAKCSVETVLGS